MIFSDTICQSRCLEGLSRYRWLHPSNLIWNPYYMEQYGMVFTDITAYEMIWYDMMWHIESFNNPKWCSHYKLISSAKLVKILLRNWISEDQWTSFLTLHHGHKMNIKNRRWKWEKTDYEDYKDKVVSKHTQRCLKIKPNRKI